MVWRNEIKHIIGPGDRAAVCANLDAVARRDPHVGPDGTYFVRSLYFDNFCDTALRDKLDGVNEREKFRIRCYNHDPALIRLEKKLRRNGRCCKLSAALSAEEAQKIVDGDWGWMPGSGRATVIELYAKLHSQCLRPRTLVDYTRIPFVYDPGNVRVTVDYNIRTGLRATDFLNPGCVTVPAGEPLILLEVKWDEFLPECIRRAVQLKNRRETAFSKYRACRIYG